MLMISALQMVNPQLRGALVAQLMKIRCAAALTVRARMGVQARNASCCVHDPVCAEEYAEPSECGQIEFVNRARTSCNAHLNYRAFILHTTSLQGTTAWAGVFDTTRRFPGRRETDQRGACPLVPKLGGPQC